MSVLSNLRRGSLVRERLAELRHATHRAALTAVVVAVACVLSGVARADGRKPGSVLVFPIHHSSPGLLTLISVTNTNLQPPSGITLGGSTNLHFQYVNAQPNPILPLQPYGCAISNRTEFVTPGDTMTRLVACHNPDALTRSGYLVVSAQDPLLQSSPWCHNDLIGSELMISANGGICSINAISFRSPQPTRSATDRDGDGQLDFDGIEYEGAPDDLILDTFMATDSFSLSLINMTGGLEFTTTLRIQIWNDNEFALSTLLSFKCWFETRLQDISPVFDGVFLYQNTPNDPGETDIDCDGISDMESGWARIIGLETSSFTQSIPNPAVIGALTPGLHNFPDAARLLWESPARQFNGDFFKFGSADPEYPE